MLGLSKREIQRRFDEIVEFAELKDFIDAPVKTYSSGMYMRLGFAVAIHVDPDVLLIDEVLAVGDQAFTVKCLDKFAEFRRRNKTILLVTHSLDLVEKFCDRALWLDKGKTLAEGEPKRVVASYLIDVGKDEEAQLAKQEAASVAAVAGQREGETSADGAARVASSAMPSDVVNTPADMFQATEGRWGSREVEITEVSLHGADGEVGHVFQSGEPLEMRLKTRAHQPLEDFVFGIGLFNADGHLLLRHQHEHRGTRAAGDHRRRRDPVPHRQPRPRRRHVQDRRRRAPARRLPVRLPPAALHLPRQVANQGCRHLSAAARVGVQPRHPVQGATLVGPESGRLAHEERCRFNT